jgi:hypothetical protein
LGLTIRVIGRASRRGIVPRLPGPDRLLADARAWIETEYGPVVRAARVDLAEVGTELVLELYPAADPVSITADPLGVVVASADTSATGPGYHTFVARLLERLGDEVGIEWVREDPPAPGGPAPAAAGLKPSPAAGRRALAERHVVERSHRAFLERSLARIIELRRGGARSVQIGLPPGTYFQFEGAIATPLGPRDDAWLARAVTDGNVAADIRPWWADATDARYMLGRALVILWTEIRWRPPADETERRVMDEALTLLRRAMPMEPTLPYPWREWAELIDLRGIGDPAAERVRPRVERVDPRRPLIGYHRRPVAIVHEGWALEVPGSFSEHRTPEEWQGGDRGRNVTLAAVVTGAGGGPMPAEAFLARFAGDLGTDVLHHQDGEVTGRARIGTDARDGLEVGVLEAFSAVSGRGAAIRITFDDPGDWQWAVNLWRSLRPES